MIETINSFTAAPRYQQIIFSFFKLFLFVKFIDFFKLKTFMSPSCPYILYSLNILLMYVMNVQKFNAIKQSDNKITSVKREREE